MNKVTVKPGQITPISGQYRVVGGNEITLVRGKVVPPTPRPGQTAVLVDRTKHK